MRSPAAFYFTLTDRYAHQANTDFRGGYIVQTISASPKLDERIATTNEKSIIRSSKLHLMAI